MIIIGLAGNIGSGKSTTAAYLRSLGYIVFDSENAAKSAVLDKGNPCLRKVAELFGPESILPDGTLNRPWVADIIFRDSTLMREFETIMQQQVWNDLQRFLVTQKDRGTAVIFVDLPLMVEMGWHTVCNSIWLIATPDDIRLQRAIARDRNLGKELVMKRNNTQLSTRELRKYADVVIDNSGSFDNTILQINEQLWKLKLQM
jgi:dephospho-CoA kinase